MEESVTPKQVAQAIGLSEASLKRWCDKGLLPCCKTAGGHRRLPLVGVLDFLRKANYPLVRPEVLGLPSNTGQGKTVLERACSLMIPALETGDEEAFRRITFDLYLAGQSVAVIGDLAIAPAFAAIGHRWETGATTIFHERRAVEMCLRTLAQLRAALPAPSRKAPLAIGGSVLDDPYRLPTMLVEVALREAGWNAQSFGGGLPIETVCAALRSQRPQLCWLSVSSIPDGCDFPACYEPLYRAASELSIPIVVGGRGLVGEMRSRMVYSAFCDNLRQLVTFADSLHRSADTSSTLRAS